MKRILKNKSEGITLIALVVTIVVLLILAGITLTFVMGEDGIINMAKQAAIATENAQVDDALQLKAAEHLFKDIEDETQTSLILYLRQEGIIDENNVINVEKLVGPGLSTGKGSFDTKKDIYILEEQGIASSTRLASTNVIKIAEESISAKIYNLVYYDKSGVGRIINNIRDGGSEETGNMITFTIDGETYHAKEGTTWKEFVQKHPDEFIIDDMGMVYYDHNILGRQRDDGQPADVVLGDEKIADGATYGTGGFAECVRGDSLILTNRNNETTLAKDVRNGDAIVYYNFETNKLEEGIVSKVYIHKNAINFVKYTFEDGSYLEVTDYHPIYTQEGWKSLTNRNGYEKPQIGDKVKTEKGWKTLTNIEEYKRLEDCYDFAIKSKEGKTVNNYFANGTLVQSSIN